MYKKMEECMLEVINKDGQSLRMYDTRLVDFHIVLYMLKNVYDVDLVEDFCHDGYSVMTIDFKDKCIIVDGEFLDVNSKGDNKVVYDKFAKGGFFNK